MRERPILFSAPMVRALLDGSKTQTRRMVKLQPGTGVEPYNTTDGRWNWVLAATGHGTQDPFLCPYGRSGDRLWVREAIRLVPGQEPDDGTGRVLSVYNADGALTVADAWPWKRSYLPPMHCPRGLSRMSLEITGVRVERLASISDADCAAEGAPGGHGAIPGYGYNATPMEHYRHVWEQINGAGSWDLNPWVWCVSFNVEHA